MAEPVEYRIVVESASDSNGSANGNGKKTVATSANSGKSSNGEGKSTSKVVHKVAIGIAYAEQIADAIIVPQINTVGLRTGHEALQQRISFGYHVARSTFDTAKSMAIGAIVGNGIGGAVVGAAVSIATKVAGIVQNQYAIDVNRNVENVSISLNNIRAGASGSRWGKDQY